MSDEAVLRGRNRVVDHWKRLFAIVSGFSITVACVRAYSCLLVGDVHGLMLFVAFIATLLPVFHGMERSLDLRYLEPRSPIPTAPQLMGDTVVLIISALFFLVLGLSIRDHSQPWLADRSEALRLIFNWAFIGFLAFDSLVLFSTRKRLRQIAPESGAHDAHSRLAILNVISAAVLVVAALLGILTGFLLAAIAVVRTLIDYTMSNRFLYPQAELSGRE